MLVGEMRDLETVAIAIETAETGHLVFGTLHTSSAPSTVDRIIDQFPADRQGQIRVMLAESLKGVISQMLCKKIGGGRVPVLEVLIGTPSVVEPDPRGQDLPDPVDHADGQEVRHVPDERELHRPGEEEDRGPAGGLRQGLRQGGPPEHVQEEQHRHVVGARGARGPGRGRARPERATDVRRASPARAGPGVVVERGRAPAARATSLIYPTDTLYALGGRGPRRRGRGARVRAAKGREEGKPLPLVAADVEQARGALRGLARRPRTRWPRGSGRGR